MAELSLMSWNVRYFGHGVGGLRATWTWKRRIAEAVASQRDLPDVIALQEVEARSLRAGLHPSPQLDRFVGCLNAALARRGWERTYRGLYYPAHTYGVGAASLYTTGLAVLVADTVIVESDNAEEPHDITHLRLRAFGPFKQKRIVGHVRLRHRAGGPSLDLFNTHLSLPAFLEVGPHRVPERMGHGSNQLREIDKVLEFAEEHGGRHAVVVGDFNSLPGSPVYDAVVRAGWRDATPTHLHEVGTAAFLDRRMHIDHIFARPRVRFSHLEAHSVDEGPYSGLSDHAPKLGRVDLAS